MVFYNKHVKGINAEAAALKFLNNKKHKLLFRNYRCVYGEIDLIMQDHCEVVFVEVRLRSSLAFGSASESVHYKKQLKIIKTAHQFLQQYPDYANSPTRFDVIAIHPIDNRLTLEWIRNAFDDCLD